jgi:hypothetical protein
LELPIDLWRTHCGRQCYAQARSGKQGGVKKITSFSIEPLPSQLFYGVLWPLLALGRDITIDKTNRNYTLRTLTEVSLDAIAQFCGFDNINEANGLDNFRTNSRKGVQFYNVITQLLRLCALAARRHVGPSYGSSTSASTSEPVDPDANPSSRFSVSAVSIERAAANSMLRADTEPDYDNSIITVSHLNPGALLAALSLSLTVALRV